MLKSYLCDIIFELSYFASSIQMHFVPFEKVLLNLSYLGSKFFQASHHIQKERVGEIYKRQRERKREGVRNEEVRSEGVRSECARERGKEIERERDRDRESEKQRDGQRGREKDRERERQSKPNWIFLLNLINFLRRTYSFPAV